MDKVFVIVIEPYTYFLLHMLCRKVKVVRKPAGKWLLIGISAPGSAQPGSGYTYTAPSAYGIESSGEVWAAGKRIISDCNALPASSIVRADLFRQRAAHDKVFRVGDEVVVVLDCTAHTLRLQSPTVQHVIPIQQQHHQLQWVLNVNFSGGEHQVSLH